MKVQTSRFGEVEMDGEQVISFPDGLLGFEDQREFFLMPLEGNEVFHWLQAVKEPDLAFLLVDPFAFFPSYSIQLDEPLLAKLEIEERSDVFVLTTVNIPEVDVSAATTNLLGPVVLNLRSRKGTQVIVDGASENIKTLLFQQGSGKPRKAAG